MTAPRQAMFRISGPDWARLEALLTRRYPSAEWATFFAFGWRVADDTLVVTAASLTPPGPGDMNESVECVEILEPYTLRTVMAATGTRLAVGVIHSHPEGFRTLPSSIDDDMDAYFTEYFGSFLGERPYASLIFAKDANGKRSFSGRVWFRGELLQVTRVAIAGAEVQELKPSKPVPSGLRERTARASSLYGEAALARLWHSTVTIIGVGGTGSAVAEALARAGVGQLILVDVDVLDPSNVERVHGSEASHLLDPPLKVALVGDLCRRVNPDCEVIAIHGNCLQPLALDWMTKSDLVLGCTDTMHSRVALSDLAYRYLVPVIDVGVQLDGAAGAVTAQCIQFVRYEPGLPCAYCRGLVDSQQLAAELMTEAERAERRRQAGEAQRHGRDGAMYWRELPQLLTVGPLTTVAGAMVAGYAVGMLTGTSRMPAELFQMDLLSAGLGYVALNVDANPTCACVEVVGHADRAPHRAVIAAPQHWSTAAVTNASRR